MRIRNAVLIACITLLTALPGPARADSIDDAFNEIETSIDAAMAAVETQWEALVAAEEAKWQALQEEVEAKWDTFVAPSEKEWVDYSDDRDVRARVDYEDGTVTVEVLIRAEAVKVPPKDEPVPTPLPEAAVNKIAAEVERISEPEPGKTLGPVEDQVKTAQGEPLTAANASQFVRSEVAPKAVVEPQVIKGKDGVERRKARVTIPMIPEHLYVRAAKYQDLVVQEAARYDLEPQLVFAVIQTESYFNPRARSPAYAFGLMQLIPRYGALEAYEYLEGEKRVVAPEYLYVPENNVRLGATYLHLLNTRYYGKIADPEKREVLVVASYNWGPTAVRKGVVNAMPINTASAADVRAMIERRAPQETRDYVARVTQRKPIYDGLLQEPPGGVQ